MHVYTCIFKTKRRINVSLRIALKFSLSHEVAIYLANQKIAAYFAPPLTLVHLAIAPAAVTHSMTE